MKFDLNQDVREETGNYKNKYGLKINNFKINFYKTLSNFKNYDKIETIKKLKLFSDFYLPFELTQIRITEISINKKQYTIEEAKELSKKEAIKQIEEEIGSNIEVLDKKINIYEKDAYVETEVIYEVQEKIGTNEKIIF